MVRIRVVVVFDIHGASQFKRQYNHVVFLHDEKKLWVILNPAVTAFARAQASRNALQDKALAPHLAAVVALRAVALPHTTVRA